MEVFDHIFGMTTLLDYRTTLAYLAYLGFPQTPLTSALQLTRPRRAERRKGKVSRGVFLCYVCGAAGSGKTSLLRNFVGKPYREAYEPTSKLLSVVNTVETDGVQKYLVLQEFGSKYEADMLRSSKKLDMADVIAYVHDSSDTNSFSYISNLRQQYNLDHIPALSIATKSDLDLALQRHEVQPDVYCRRLGLHGPHAVSIKTGRIADVFQVICKIGVDPIRHIPGGIDKSMTPFARIRYLLKVLLMGGSILASITLMYRYLWRPGGWTMHLRSWFSKQNI